MSKSYSAACRHLALAAALVTASASSQAANLFTNGSFETGDSSSWGEEGGALVTDADAHTGSFAFSGFSGDAVTQTFAAVSTTDITELSFWGKHSDGLYDLVLLSYSDSSSANIIVNTLGGSDDWTYVNITGQLEAGKSLVSFQIYGTSPDAALLDDFVLTGPMPAVPEPSTCALMALGLAGIGLSARRRQA